MLQFKPGHKKTHFFVKISDELSDNNKMNSIPLMYKIFSQTTDCRGVAGCFEEIVFPLAYRQRLTSGHRDGAAGVWMYYNAVMSHCHIYGAVSKVVQ